MRPTTIILAAVLVFASCFVTANADDLGWSHDTVDAFFASDYRGLSAENFELWISPGNEFCIAATGHNCDGSDVSPEHVASTQAVWAAMTQCRRWRVRLHHQADIKRRHNELEIWLYYTTMIPRSLREQIEACLAPDEFEFIGRKFSVARATIIARTSLAFWRNFFPQDRMDHVVVGWEGAAQ